MILIGLCGAAGSGKGEVAKRLATSHKFSEISFADPLYEAVSAIAGRPVEWLKDRHNKESVIQWIGKSPRELLQLLGTEFGRNMIDPDIWVRAAMQRADSMLEAGLRVVVTDVRFDNEAEAIQEAGGVVFMVTRPDVTVLNLMTAAHASERGIMSEHILLTIENKGSLEALGAAVDDAVASLYADIM